MKLRKGISALAAAGLLTVSVFSAAAPALASDVTDSIRAKNTAVESAKKAVPASAVLTGVETGDDAYKLSFKDPDTLSLYEVELDKATQKVKEVEITSSQNPGSVTVTKTAEDAKAAILAEYPNATNVTVEKKEKDIGGATYVVYKAEFETAEYKAEALLNPATLAIGKEEREYK